MNAEQKWQEATDILNNSQSEDQINKAIQLVKEAVSENHAGAYFTLGQIYYNGKGVEEDYEKAYECFKTSLSLGYDKAKLMLAIYMINGDIVEKDIDTAEKYLRELAEQNEPNACATLADFIFQGVFPDINQNEGKIWVEKAANLGHPYSMARLGQIYGNLCEDDKANYWFDKASQEGVNGVEEARSQYTPETYPQRRADLVRFYVSTKEYDKIFALVNNDIEKGDISAMYLLADIHIGGLGQEQYAKDMNKSLEIYQKLSEMGEAHADYMIGRLYGKYEEMFDIDKANEYYQKAADNGDADALCQLAYSYLQDPDIDTQRRQNFDFEQDIQKGMHLLVSAAQAGQPSAFYALALCYQKGKYVEKDEQKAFEMLTRSVQIEAMSRNVTLMGDFYRDGIGTEQNYEAAVYNYQWAANNNYVAAMYSLSKLYDEGKGVEKDSEKAAELRSRCWEINNWDMFGTLPLNVAKEQAKQGDPEAMCQLGVRYKDGNGVEQNLDIASDWWLKAAMKGHSMACHNLGVYYFSEKHDIENALKWLEKSAEQDNVLSFNVLGDIYVNGWGVDVDVEKGVEYLVKSVELGDEDAPMKLAGLYHDGNQIERDVDKAKQYLEKYLEYDSADAHFRMGQCLLDGDMYEKDYGKALEHLRIAVKSRCYDAAPLYTSLLWGDEGVGKNQQEVLDTFTELATEYDGTAWYYLFMLYNDPNNDHQDTTKAMECLNKAAEIGDGDALTIMGLMYQNGDKLPKDDVKAFECFDKAASKGHIRGYVNAALCYREGRGVDKDIQKSLDMLCTAADNGNAFSAREAAMMLFKGDYGLDKDEDRAIALLEKHTDNDTEACYMLAYLLLIRVNREDKYSWEEANKAAQLMEKAANAGHPDATFHLAGLYMQGSGVFADEGKAKELYSRCVDNGFKVEESNKNIEDYLSDEGSVNFPQFIYWQTIAENNKSKLSDDTVLTDEEGNVDLLKIAESAAQCGEPNAQIYCGSLELKDNPDKAEEYFGKVIELGRSDLALDLGRMYFFGNGVEEDVQRAASYFQKGVDQGDYECMMFLAMIYKALGDEEALEYAKQLYGAVYSGSTEDSDLEKRSAYHYGEILYNELQNGKSMDDYEVSELMCLMKYCSPVGLVKIAADALVKMAEKVDSVEILKMVPVFYTMAGESQTAFEVIDYYLSQLPEDDFIITQRADCNALLCHDEEALKDYKEKALLQEDLESSRANYANILLKHKRFDDVVNFVAKAIESGFNDCELLVYRGKAYESLGKHELAVKDFTEASTMPVDGDSELMPAFALLLLGKDDECKQKIESGLETLEDELSYTMCYAYNNAAYYYSLMGNTEKATEYGLKSFETGYLLFDYMKAYKPELFNLHEIQSYIKEHTSK